MEYLILAAVAALVVNAVMNSGGCADCRGCGKEACHGKKKARR